MVSNTLLRKNAREQLGGSIFKNKWMTMLVVCAILPLMGGFLSVALIGFGTMIATVLSGTFSYGMARATYYCATDRKWDIFHVFRGFKEWFGPSALLGFLVNAFTTLWSLLLIVPGVIKSYAYSMSFYIAQEHGGEGNGVIECMRSSKEMMNGYKKQLFLLDLSFVGWYLLGALCFGIGVFFVVPYHQVARASFYQALKEERSRIVYEDECKKCEQREDLKNDQ